MTVLVILLNNIFIDVLPTNIDLYEWANYWALNSKEGKDIEYFSDGRITVNDWVASSNPSIFISADNGIIELQILVKEV